MSATNEFERAFAEYTVACLEAYPNKPVAPAYWKHSCIALVESNELMPDGLATRFDGKTYLDGAYAFLQLLQTNTIDPGSSGWSGR